MGALMNVVKTFVVIVAGGQGTRMGSAIPKQFLELNGKPVLFHTIHAFANAIPEAEIILVLPAHQISYAQMVLASFPSRIDLTIVAGGETRFQSVQNGLKCIESSVESIVFVHDGVRPLVSKKMIQDCYDQAMEKGSAIPAISVADSMRILVNDHSQPIDRTKMRLIQTPQTFKSSVLLPAMEQPFQDSFTDEATVVEAFGQRIYLVEGERSNLKITTKEDLVIAAALMREMEIA